ncbi:hypothetical protein SDC9_172619 [bioreactor metagenome]|uniref:Uncharacterized protein n=1 Tax=bioreactor metagenome TaxID=1076179 RepID=A0A645GGV9_9ZZZZ
MVVSPPALFPGVGCPSLRSCPAEIDLPSTLFTIPRNFSLSFISAKRSARRCSAPITSVVSLKMLLPPNSTSISDATPIVGFDASPLVGSLPPHSRPSIISLISNSTLFCFASIRAILLAISAPFATALHVPPSS